MCGIKEYPNAPKLTKIATAYINGRISHEEYRDKTAKFFGVRLAIPKNAITLEEACQIPEQMFARRK